MKVRRKYELYNLYIYQRHRGETCEAHCGTIDTIERLCRGTHVRRGSKTNCAALIAFTQFLATPQTHIQQNEFTICSNCLAQSIPPLLQRVGSSQGYYRFISLTAFVTYGFTLFLLAANAVITKPIICSVPFRSFSDELKKGKIGKIRDESRDRRIPIDLDTSIQYLNSEGLSYFFLCT